MKIYNNFFETIISPESLFFAWDVFVKDKRKKRDVQEFEWNLEENIFQLYHDLKNQTYKHGRYSGFYISDPKVRHIHKASVRDRVIHHAVFSALNPIFEPTFIAFSFSCRINKETHKGVKYLERVLRSVSKNCVNPCFALKCDIKKFFDSVDHSMLFEILIKRVKDEKVIWLLREIIESYSSSFLRERERE